ncbi:heat-shock protein Hsp20 [Bifidobacterium dolichotidis]|uniref:Heat-shock protein Hsp20 n=1 Tax=Bifidobacterium dolichotidis TaxID=2306976 RepID=A0A430FKF3_9BIFI|nr:HAD family hydrolase [Bifidobacterium dolichotidis]RSX53395.1 heat-shock protein Hsp20 [Bifidobacterium dolichotidis]
MAVERRYDVIAFDLYGTLMYNVTDENREEAWNALREELDRYGARYHNNEELRHEYDACFADDAAHMDRDPEYEPELLDTFRGLFTSLWFDPDDDEAERCAWAFRQGATTLIDVYPGAIELLRTLRKEGYRVVLLSNAQTCYTVPEMRELGLLNEFDDVTISSEENMRKPSAALFATVAERNHVSPDRVLMVGNNVMCDIEGAVRAGYDAVYLHTDGDPDAPRARDLAALAVEGADYAAVLEYIHSTERELVC